MPGDRGTAATWWWHPAGVALLPDVLPAGAIELRRWRIGSLAALMNAIGASYPELQRWMAWAQTMPTAEQQRDVLEAGEAAFDADREWGYLLYEQSSGDLVGGAGLHRRGEPQVTEIGYWVRSDRTGRGYATATARALTEAAFSRLPDIERVEIHMDKANAASAAVPRKLGYRLDREVPRDILALAHTGTGLVWVLDRPAPPGHGGP
jgi:RimJ/RimL family protein N-acetyltransferase